LPYRVRNALSVFKNTRDRNEARIIARSYAPSIRKGNIKLTAGNSELITRSHAYSAV
jgi:hypothetical protein